MSSKRLINIIFIFVAVMMVGSGLSGCKTTQPSDLITTPVSIWASGVPATAEQVATIPTLSYTIPPTRPPGSPEMIPTPDSAHYQVGGVLLPETYIVQSGDMLSSIAQKYGVSLQALAQANNIIDINRVEVGQVLTLPFVPPQPMGPDYKIIPDSELVYGPLSTLTDVEAIIQSKSGYLLNFTQNVNGEDLSAAQIILRVAQSYSINPRLLLAVLEYRSGWLTNPRPDPVLDEQPFGFYDVWYHGLYRQLAWAAVHLNSGFYRWNSNEVSKWVLTDGNVVPVDPTINAGTAAVQNLFAQLDDYSTWLRDISPGGFLETYKALFGYPFDFTIESLVPTNLVQPIMNLPFSQGETWSFTGGPHLAWDAGTPYGALDFAPPGEALGCVETDYWVTAVASGLVTRAANGEVILDLDGDGNEGSGWVVLYMHIESRDRVSPGSFLHSGDRVGHPSCEGGISSGTHIHIARKFNGEWISALGSIPFNLSGWISGGTGEQYVGTLTRNNVIVENYEGKDPINQIQR